MNQANNAMNGSGGGAHPNSSSSAAAASVGDAGSSAHIIQDIGKRLTRDEEAVEALPLGGW